MWAQVDICPFHLNSMYVILYFPLCYGTMTMGAFLGLSQPVVPWVATESKAPNQSMLSIEHRQKNKFLLW